MSKKLFTAGPTEVREEILTEMARPPIGHRGAEMHELMAGILPRLRRVFGVGDGPDFSVFLATSSATGLMEGAVVTTVPPGGRVLSLICGGFGERWRAIAQAHGREAVPLRIDWGRGIPPEAVERALKERRYDAVTLVHNETSTGVLNPLSEIAAVTARFRDVLLLVDAVSSLGGVPVDVGRNAVDVCLAGSQKCLALPPGLAVGALSARALERARKNPARGFYFDLTRCVSAAEKGEAPFTPTTPHYFALHRQLEAIEEETLEARYARHLAMRDAVHAWAEGRFSLYAEEGRRSPTVTVLEAPEGFDVEGFRNRVRDRGFILGAGYGPLKERCFRIGHMGDLTLEDVRRLTETLRDCMGEDRAFNRTQRPDREN